MTATGRGLATLVAVLLLAVPVAGPPAAERHRSDVVAEPSQSRALTEGRLLGSPAAAPGETPVANPDAVVRWDSPLPGPIIVVDPFRPPAKKWLPGHRGVDLLGWTGGPVSAVADGVVSYSGVIDGVGIVSVRHGPDLRSTYQPVGDRVGTGTVVASGERLGLLEDGGHCLLVTCLHLGAVRGRETYVDPMLFLNGWEVSLLPLG